MSFVYIHFAVAHYTRVYIVYSGYGINRHHSIYGLFSFWIGLKKFLAQYPAIFVIDGDHVLVNSYEKSTSNDLLGGGTRDYIQESKDYFKHKLLQYGIGTEVPIKSLLGHRSQASPQIRHISGKSILIPRNSYCHHSERTGND